MILIFLRILHCCFYIWISRHLLTSLLFVFSWCVLFNDVVISWGFLCHWYSVVHFWVSLVVESLKIVSSLVIKLTRLATGNLSFLFQKVAHWTTDQLMVSLWVWHDPFLAQRTPLVAQGFHRKTTEFSGFQHVTWMSCFLGSEINLTKK